MQVNQSLISSAIDFVNTLTCVMYKRNNVLHCKLNAPSARNDCANIFSRVEKNCMKGCWHKLGYGVNRIWSKQGLPKPRPSAPKILYAFFLSRYFKFVLTLYWLSSMFCTFRARMRLKTKNIYFPSSHLYFHIYVLQDIRKIKFFVTVIIFQCF